MTSGERARVARILALADRESLLARLEAVGRIPDFEYLREPQKGLVMVRGRAGGTGSPFNLCEVLVSRCSVSVRGRPGHAYVLGDDPSRALAAAVAAALAGDPEFSGRISAMVAALEEELARKRERERKRTMETRVEFFTLARGEDED
ncbi:MAG: phosphonate C-P lyase system protein PhnG [Deltaproteobacteria bacterium]|jgi:alpha-D-ribose 1-methylphosphonate 5-triphosphate synthase subunit PhnG|nr:phosphonate C-P lyase system protein PhnG [Deltaproteobacteria bacterium]